MSCFDRYFPSCWVTLLWKLEGTQTLGQVLQRSNMIRQLSFLLLLQVRKRTTSWTAVSFGEGEENKVGILLPGSAPQFSQFLLSHPTFWRWVGLCLSSDYHHKGPQAGGFNNSNLFLRVLEGAKSKIKVLAKKVSFWGPFSRLPGCCYLTVCPCESSGAWHIL